MSAPKVTGPGAAMTPEYRKHIMLILERMGYLEWMAVNMFSHSLKFVTRHKHRLKFIDDLEEEADHYERCARLYHDLGGDMEAFVLQRMRERPGLVPYPESYEELVVVQFLMDRAGREIISEYPDCSYVPYAEAMRKVLEDEAEHEGYGDAYIKIVCRDASRLHEIQRLFDAWFKTALLTFGHANTRSSRYCIEVGLRKRDNGEIMRDYIDGLKETMASCGLVFPSRERLQDDFGIDLPDYIDLALTRDDS